MVSTTALVAHAAGAQLHAPAAAAAPATGTLPVDALECAPGMRIITITINSFFVYWNCGLAALVVGAGLRVGRRRSRRSPSPMLKGFFSGDIVIEGIPGATAIAVLLTSAWSSSHAHPPRGQWWPMGVTPPRARVVAQLAGPTPPGGSSTARAPENCSHAGTSTADGTTREQLFRRRQMATCGPAPPFAAQLHVHQPPPLLRSGFGRLPACEANGGTCCTTLARVSSQGGGDQGRT